MRGSVVACVVLSGCYQSVYRPTCDEHAVDVADDEQTPEGTAANLLANVVGTDTVDGLLAPDDTVVPVTWSVERGEGSAQWIESEETTEEISREFGFGGDSILTIGVFCDNRVEAPVNVAVATAGGEVEVAVESVVASLPDVTSAGWQLLGTGAYGDATFPVLPGVDPADFTDKVSFAILRGLGTTEEPVSGRAGWEGTEAPNSNVSITSHTIVEF